MKKYFVTNKSDDYGACKTEIVETILKNAKEYYHHKVISEEDFEVLKKYIDFVDYEDEKERSDDNRFYGN